VRYDHYSGRSAFKGFKKQQTAVLSVTRNHSHWLSKLWRDIQKLKVSLTNRYDGMQLKMTELGTPRADSPES
jgi:hypothetical protein